MKIGTTRMETFSDGVIAIIITIMVLELKLPDAKTDTTTEILTHLQGLLPYWGAYAFSFMMIGIFWTNHHHMFHLLEKTDEHLLWQNLFSLFWLSLIPLATATIGANPKLPISAALYGVVMLMNALAFAYMRAYTIRKGLVHHDESKDLERKIRFATTKAKTKSFIGVMAYLLSIPLAFVNVFLSYLCFAIPPLLFLIPTGIDDEKLAEKIEEKNG